MKCHAVNKNGLTCEAELRPEDAIVLSKAEEIEHGFNLREARVERKKEHMIKLEDFLGFGKTACAKCLKIPQSSSMFQKMGIRYFNVAARQRFLASAFEENAPAEGYNEPQDDFFEDDKNDETFETSEDSFFDSLGEDEEEAEEFEDDTKICYCCGNSLSHPIAFLPKLLQVETNPLFKWRGSPLCDVCETQVKHAQLPVRNLREELLARLEKSQHHKDTECPLCGFEVYETDRWLDLKVAEKLPVFKNWAGRKFCKECIPELKRARLKTFKNFTEEEHLDNLLKVIELQTQYDEACIRCGEDLHQQEFRKVHHKIPVDHPAYPYRDKLVCVKCVRFFKQAGVRLYYPRTSDSDLLDMLGPSNEKPKVLSANVRERQKHRRKQRNSK